jgi:hypothetical protein
VPSQDEGIAGFLRARYTEAREREHAKRRSIPSPFDGHEVTVSYNRDDGAQVLVDGHPYPTEQYFEIATEPAPDPDVLADLDAKLGIVDWYETASTSPELNPDAWQIMRQVLLLLALALALPFAAHPDYDERWRP